MAYATQAQIQLAAGGLAELKQIADWDGDGEVDAEAIEYAQRETDDAFDGAFALRYAIPISVGADQRIVESRAARMCMLVLRRTRNHMQEDHWRQIEEMDKWLERVKDGRERLGDPAPPKSDAVRSQVIVNTRDISRSNLKGFT